MDESLRRLGRARDRTGAPEDEARWLLARLRCGDVDAETLHLAALAGDRAAGLALGLDDAGPAGDDLAAWLAEAERLGPLAHLSAALALAARDHELAGQRAGASLAATDGALLTLDRWLRGEADARELVRARAEVERMAPGAALLLHSCDVALGRPGRPPVGRIVAARGAPLRGALRAVAADLEAGRPTSIVAAALAAPSAPPWRSALWTLPVAALGVALMALPFVVFGRELAVPAASLGWRDLPAVVASILLISLGSVPAMVAAALLGQRAAAWRCRRAVRRRALAGVTRAAARPAA